MYNQPNTQFVPNKPTSAYIVSLIGGIIGLLIALGFLGFGAISYISYQSYVSDYYYTYYDLGMFGWGYSILLGLGIWMLITSVLIIVFARKLNANPMEHSKWGALILVFSIIGVGGLLGLIGGILALIYNPTPIGMQSQPYGYAPPQQSTYQQQPQQTPAQTSVPQNITRFCPQCGRVINENVKFCPNCGKAIG
jgi:hypothetical protein